MKRRAPIAATLALLAPRFVILSDGMLHANHLGGWQGADADLRRLTGSA